MGRAETQKEAAPLSSASSGRWFAATTKVITYWLTVFATAVRASTSTVRCCGMGSTMRPATTAGCCCVRSGTTGCTAGPATTRCYCVATSAVACIAAPVSTAGDIPSAATSDEAMFAPAVAVAPVRPGSHAQKDAVIEIARAIKATGRTAVWCVLVIAVGTDRLNADADANLCTGVWRQGQRDEQGCRSGQKKTAHGELMSPARYAFNLPHNYYPPELLLSLSKLSIQTRWFKYRPRAGG